MFDWLFRPSCPCDPSAKAWVEKRLAWLASEFEDSAFSGLPVILPTPAFFPDKYDGSKASVRMILDRVCGYMDVPTERIRLKMVEGNMDTLLVNEAGHDIVPNAAGTFQAGEHYCYISIDKSELANPMGLVGTIAHELSHVRLLWENRIHGETYDNELLTDLTVVHFGLGIFLANSPRNWHSQDRLWPGTGLRKPEYMSPPMFGWALAILALFRKEEKPAWECHLNSGARANLRQGLRYLKATNDTAYRPV